MQVIPVLTCVLISTALMAQTTSDANTKFAKLSEEFIHETLALAPSNASQAGYHQHVDPKTGKTVALDAMLDDVSPAGIANLRGTYAKFRERFRSETPLASLGAEDAADWQLIDDQIGFYLLEFDRIQNYRHNPTYYVELLGSALFQPFTDDYAPQEVRLGHILSRIAATPRFLDQARSQLVDADPVFIKVAIEENDGNLDLIENTIAPAIPAGSKLAGSQLQAQYDQVAPPAITALKNFSSWLRDDLGKRKTDRTWRLGKELYAEKFRLVMETPVTPAQVLAEAEDALKKTRAEMLAIALPLHKQYYPRSQRPCRPQCARAREHHHRRSAAQDLRRSSQARRPDAGRER